MQAYRDYIGGHKLEFLPRLKRCQNYHLHRCHQHRWRMWHESLRRYQWLECLLEVITWHAKHFFTWQASIPPAACPKQRLSLVIWIQLVDGSLSNNRLHSSLKTVFCDVIVTKLSQKWLTWQKRFLWSHGSFTSIKCWLDFGSSKSVTPHPASLHSSWPKLKVNFSTFQCHICDR